MDIFYFVRYTEAINIIVHRKLNNTKKQKLFCCFIMIFLIAEQKLDMLQVYERQDLRPHLQHLLL